MGISYVPAISAGLLLPSGILQQIGQTLGDTENTLWIPGGGDAGDMEKLEKEVQCYGG